MSRKNNRNQSQDTKRDLLEPTPVETQPCLYEGDQDWIKDEMKAGGKFSWIS
ncbi:MAG: hypothetical protein Q8T09_02910 [Candidatus Melainabacteria bacterium]|nr:hypothetical protein [Candidatus Melainabacteria bacterium]